MYAVMNHPKVSKTCLKRPVKDQKLGFKTNYHSMQVKSIAECSKGRILPYFRPTLSYYLSLRSLFSLFLSGSLRQVLLYMYENSTKCIWMPQCHISVNVYDF